MVTTPAAVKGPAKPPVTAPEGGPVKPPVSAPEGGGAPAPAKSRPSLKAPNLANTALANSQAKRVVLVSVAGVGVLSTVAYVKRNDSLPPPRLIAGVFVSGVILAGIAEFQPSIAKGLAAVMLVTAAFAIGGDAWQGVGNAVGTRIRATATTASSGGGGGVMRPL